MSVEFATILLFGGLLVLLSLRVPVVFAIGSIGLVVSLIVQGPASLSALALVTFRQSTSITLMAIPMFLLMGNLLVHSGLSDRMFTAFSYWLSGFRGGLAIVSIIVCVALAMCGGFGPGILTMGLIAVPAMLKNGYDKKIALGTVMAGGVLGQIIPPSVLIIIFGFIGRVSVGKLFMAAFIPGFLCAAFYIIYIIGLGVIKPHLLPLIDEKVTWKMRWFAVKEVVIPILLVLLVLGSIFLGIATPTEAAAVGASGTVLICLLLKKLTWQVVTATCADTLKTSGMAIWILIAATFFGMVYAGAGAQDMIFKIVENLEINRWYILFGMQAVLLLFGMFMDDFAVVSICAPIFIPIAALLGFDVIWFSIVFILNMQVAYLTPPFGWSLILMRGVAPPEIKTSEIWRSVPPFVIMQLLVLILVMIFPSITLWLPSLMFD